MAYDYAKHIAEKFPIPEAPAPSGLAGQLRSLLPKRGAEADFDVDALVDIASKANDGFDPRLIKAVMGTESSFNRLAVSPKKAMGLMQVIPSTWRAMAAETGLNDPFDPVHNVVNGTRYLKQQHERFGGDIPLTLAAYNAGPEAVEKYGGIPPYPETQNYVVTNLKKLGLSPEPQKFASSGRDWNKWARETLGEGKKAGEVQPQEGSDIPGGLGLVLETLYKGGIAGVASLLRTYRHYDLGTNPTIDSAIKYFERPVDELAKEHKDDKRTIFGVPFKEIADLGKSLGFSAGSMAISAPVALAAGAATAAIPGMAPTSPWIGRAAGIAAGIATLPVTKRADEDMLFEQTIDTLNEESLKQNGRALTKEEINEVKQNYGNLISQHGWWEGITESADTAIDFIVALTPLKTTMAPVAKLFKSPAVQKVLANTVVSVAGKLSLMAGSEMAQEAVTSAGVPGLRGILGGGQADIEYQLGQREEPYRGWWEEAKPAARQAALQTAITGPLMLGGAHLAGRGQRKRAEADEAAKAELKARLEEHFAGNQAYQQQTTPAPKTGDLMMPRSGVSFEGVGPTTPRVPTPPIEPTAPGGAYATPDFHEKIMARMQLELDMATKLRRLEAFHKQGMETGPGLPALPPNIGPPMAGPPRPGGPTTPTGPTIPPAGPTEPPAGPGEGIPPVTPPPVSKQPSMLIHNEVERTPEDFQDIRTNRHKELKDKQRQYLTAANDKNAGMMKKLKPQVEKLTSDVGDLDKQWSAWRVTNPELAKEYDENQTALDTLKVDDQVVWSGSEQPVVVSRIYPTKDGKVSSIKARTLAGAQIAQTIPKAALKPFKGKAAPVEPVAPVVTPEPPAAPPTPPVTTKEAPKAEKKAEAKEPKTRKGIYYFPDRETARTWAEENGWPANRIIEYEKGFAVQSGPSGNYAGPGETPREFEGTEKKAEPPAEAKAKEPAKPPEQKKPAEKEPLGSIEYVEAKKQAGGKYKLFYRGTRNEVFPGEVFASANEARNYFKAMKAKEEETKKEAKDEEAEAGKPGQAPEEAKKAVQAEGKEGEEEVGKEPWQMTRTEHLLSIGLIEVKNLSDEQLKKAGISKEKAKGISNFAVNAETLEVVGDGYDDNYQDVKDAVKAGKPVPDEVLKDYPELRPTKAAPVEPTEAEAPAEEKKPTKEPKILLRDVKEAERQWAMTRQSSTNPDTDLAVSRALGNYQDIKAAYEKQQAERTRKAVPEKQEGKTVAAEPVKELTSESLVEGTRVMVGNEAGTVIRADGVKVKVHLDSHKSAKAYVTVHISQLQPEDATSAAYSEIGRIGEKLSEEGGKLDVDKPKLISLLGEQNYSSNAPTVAIKELVQNSFDAIKEYLWKTKAGKRAYGKIDIHIDGDSRTITIKDDGVGMSKETIKKAFFTIGGSQKNLPPELSSGGLGLAKLQFMFSSSRIKVDTVRDGVRVVVSATSEQIQNDDFRIETYSADKKEHGTTVTVQFPAKKIKSQTKEEVSIYFPSNLGGLELKQYPLIGPVEVRVHGDADWSKGFDAIYPIGKNQDFGDMSLLTKSNFGKGADQWGSADIYFGKARKERARHYVLSSGVYQFQHNFMLSMSEKIPYDIIIDIKPKVRAEHEDYPFNNTRQGFKERMKEEIDALGTYLAKITQGEMAKNLQENFKNLKEMPRTDVGADIAKINEEDLERYRRKAAEAFKAKQAEKPPAPYKPPPEVDVTSDGVYNTKTMERYTDEKKDNYRSPSFETEKPPPDWSTLKMTLTHDPSKPIFHNNTNVDWVKVGKPYGDTALFFSEMGSILTEMKEELAKSGMWGYDGYNNMFYSGVSIDKKYAGVWIPFPYKAVYINPIGSVYQPKTLFSAREMIYNTIVHELAHIVAKGHGVTHNQQMDMVKGYLEDNGLAEYYRDVIMSSLVRHERLYYELRRIFNESGTQNIAKSFEEPTESAIGREVRVDVGMEPHQLGIVPAGERQGRGETLRRGGEVGGERRVAEGTGETGGITQPRTLITTDTPLFSRKVTPAQAKGMPSEQTAKIVGEITAKWKAAPVFNFVDKVRDLSPELLAELAEQNPDVDTVVAFLAKNGEVWVISGKLADRDHLERVVLHEAIGHLGVIATLGDRLNPVLDEIYAKYGRKGLQSLADEYKLDLTKESDRRIVAFEKLAGMAEDGKEATFVQRVYGVIRRFLKRMGFQIKMSDGELLQLLRDSRLLVTEGVVPRGMVIGGVYRTYGGEKAKGWATAQGKFSSLYDKKPRFEIDDSEASWIFDNMNVHGNTFFTPAFIDKGLPTRRLPTVGDVLKHDKLFAEYPELAGLRIDVDVNPNKKTYGGLAPGGSYLDKAKLSKKVTHIEVKARDASEAMEILIHELSHAVGAIEMFARGGSMSLAVSKYKKEIAKLEAQGVDFLDAAYSVYRRFAGEIEARDAAARAGLTAAERAKTPPYSSENIPIEDAIVRFGGGGEQQSTGLKAGKPTPGDITTPEFYTGPADILFSRLKSEPQDVIDVAFGKNTDQKGLYEIRIPAWIARTNKYMKRLFSIQQDRESKYSAEVFDMISKSQPLLELSKEDTAATSKVLFDLYGNKVVDTPKFVKTGERERYFGFIAKGVREVKTYDILELNDKHYEELDEYLKKKGISEPVRKAVVASRRVFDEALLVVYETMQNIEKIDPTLIEKYRQSIGKIENYFPHMRYGNWYIQAIDPNPIKESERTDEGIYVKDESGKKLHAVKYRRHFNAWTERGARRWKQRNMQDLVLKEAREHDPNLDWEKLEWEIDRVRGNPEDIFAYPIPLEAMQQIVDQAIERLEMPENMTPLEKANTKESLRQLLSEEESNIIKARGFMQHFIQSKNIPGFEKVDIKRVAHDYTTGLVGMITKMEAANKFGDVLRDIPAKKEPESYKMSVRYVSDMLQNAAKIDKYVNNLRSFFFAKYLGAVIKTSVLNLTQNVVAGVPTLSMHTSGAFTKWARAIKDIRLSVKSESLGRKTNLSDTEKQFLLDMVHEGWGQARLVTELTGRMGAFHEQMWQKAIRFAGLPMEIAERYNRLTIGLAAFRTAVEGKITNEKTLKKYGLEKGEKASPEVAKEFARDEVVGYAHFYYGKGNRPQVFRGSRGAKVLSSTYTFRTFNHNLFAMWRDMLFQEGAAGKRAFAYSIGNMILLAGLSGIPFYRTLATAIRQLFGKDPLGEEILKRTPNLLKEFVLYGAPTFLGIDLSGSIGMEIPGLGRRRIGESTAQRVAGSVGDVIGIPWALFQEMTDSMDAIAKGRLDRVPEILSPVAVKNILAAVRLSTEGATTMSGKPIARPGEKEPRKLTAREAFFKGLGFQPISKTKEFQLYRTMSDLQVYKANKQTEWANELAVATRKHDTSKIREVNKEIQEHNAKMRKTRRPEMVIDIKDALRARMKPQQAPKAMRGKEMEYAELYQLRDNLKKGSR